MPDDEVYNPFQAEEVNLNDILRRAVATKLRQRPSMDDPSARFNYASEQAGADRDFEGALSKRSSMAEADKASLINILKQYGSETEALGSNRLTYPQAMKNVAAKEEMRLDEEERQQRQARREQTRQRQVAIQTGPPAPGETQAPGGGGGALPSTETALLIQEALENVQSRNPATRKKGEDILKAFQGQDPKNMVRLNPDTGAYDEIPGALPAFQKQQGGSQQQQHPEGILVPDGKGGQMLVQPPRPPGVYQGGGGVQGQGQGQGQVPPQQMAPQPPQVQPPQGQPPQGQPPQGQPPQGAPKPGSPQANTQLLMQNLQEEQGLLQQSQQAGDADGVRRHSSNIAQLQQGIQEQQRRGGGQPQGAPQPQPQPMQQPGAPQGAPPQGQFPQPPNVPRGQPGVSNPPPSETKIYEGQYADRERTANKLNEKGSDLPKIDMALYRMEQLNTQPMFTGMIGPQMAKENLLSTFTGHKSEEGRNTEQYEKYSADLRAGLLSQYGAGSGISNADLLQVAGRVPNASMDPQTRAIMTEQLKEDLKAFAYISNRFQELTQDGMMAKNAENKAYAEYRAMNPEWGKIKFPQPKAKDQPIGPEGQTHSMKNPNSALSQTMDAITDVAKNTGRGAMNLVGLGDREAAVADVKRQEGREASEPIYRGAKNIVDTAKYAPALAFGPLGGALTAGLIGASQPKESLTGQLSTGVTEGVVGAASGGALNSARLYFVKKAMEPLFDTITSSKVGSAAYNKAITELAKLEPEFVALSKKTASDTLAPITSKVSAGWNALPNAVRQATKGAVTWGAGGGIAGGVYKYLFGDK